MPFVILSNPSVSRGFYRGIWYLQTHLPPLLGQSSIFRQQRKVGASPEEGKEEKEEEGRRRLYAEVAPSDLVPRATHSAWPRGICLIPRAIPSIYSGFVSFGSRPEVFEISTLLHGLDWGLKSCSGCCSVEVVK